MNLNWNHLINLRLNRSDIVITGLADGIKDLPQKIIALCGCLKVEIMPDDIINTLYIKKKSAILVKFRNVVIQDSIMSEYFKTKSLKRSDVEGGSIATRIYLNAVLETIQRK